jgi:Cu(I)/Ag(I) efflux system membrane fusion protein
MKRVAILGLVLLAMSAPAFAAELPAALVEAYLSAQTALANDSVKELPAAAKAIEAAATPIGAAAQPVVDGARKLGGAKDLAAARTAFGDLSTALVSYAEKSGSTLPADLHIAYCPMADKDWIQKGTEIKNPYYGSAMLTCGSIKK